MSKILLLGDSITAHIPSGIIGTQNDEVINIGIENIGIDEYFQNVCLKIDKENTDIIVLQIGMDEIIKKYTTNPIKDITNKIINFINNINRINCKFIVQSFYPTKNNEINQIIKIINDKLSEHCYYLSIEFLDIYDLLLDENEMFYEKYTDDGLHPNYEGYNIIANQINEVFLILEYINYSK